ncbi:'8 KDa' triple gene block protein [Clover yellow mosaic virus]|uniref:Movement protein TGBp3 n=1 Tax=Clover yellow mosaic virus TaxID=12177 RepID=TGB3_CYMV|nr:'8 KDa' triple gene block protein [Clover yellow mosaic virus]P16483.1 RecName: Full=Movement protein TGBp3; AltName: Full=7 kDa protein; AltName: Full=Triple gene block 3 protein; Short=TGBp3 [Clover yellow mosaic virus]BAA00372.1 6.5K protein [Clover yellow mosaic virus]
MHLAIVGALTLVLTLFVLHYTTKDDRCYILINGHSAFTNCPASPDLAKVISQLKPHNHG